MMYSEPIHFEMEFIKRTKIILQNYSGEYDTTLFINAMLGLFVIPKEKRLDEIDDSMIESTLFQRVQSSCRDRSKAAQLSLKDITRRMRNAIAHGHLVFEAARDPYGNVGTEIQLISFYDDPKTKKNYKDYEFSAQFDLVTLKVFVFALSDALIKERGDGE